MPADNPLPQGLPSLQLGDLTVPLPIVQGGMGIGVSVSGLASAVANEGGLGIISGVGIGMHEPDFCSDHLAANLRSLRREIRCARELSQGVLGVNLMVALTNHDAYVKVAAEEGIDVIFSGAGLPLKLPGLLPPGAKTKLVPIVSSPRAAKLLCKRWQNRFNRLPDGMVLEGPLAGGHLGFKPEQLTDPEHQLEVLLPQTVEVVEGFARDHAIPVIAAGGVFSGGDIYRLMQLGASGVQMGTRFVTTYECDASTAFKEAFINCKKEDLVIIKSPVGLPGRAIRNAFIDEVTAGKKRPAECPCLCITTCPGKKSPYCIALALAKAKRGDLEHGFAFAGANAYRTDRILSVRELIITLVEEYHAAAANDRPAPDGQRATPTSSPVTQ